MWRSFTLLIAGVLAYGCVSPAPARWTARPAVPPPDFTTTEHWEGYVDHRVIITLDVKKDQLCWSAEGRIPALGDVQMSFGSGREPLPWPSENHREPSRWRTTVHVLPWGDCELDVWRNEQDGLLGVICIYGAYYDVQMKRVPPAEPARPPTPWEPSHGTPYRSEEVKFNSGTVEIAGELTIPAGRGPHPAILLLSGGGATDRDGNAFAGQGDSYYRCIADHVTQCGFTVLRTDDRGVGGSSGERETATLGELADDALAAVELLAGRRDVQQDRIGLMGYSEGGNVAAIAASRSKAVSSVVLLAPLSVPSGTNYIGQLRRHMVREIADARRAARPEAEARRFWEECIELERQISVALRAGVEPSDLRRQLEEPKLFKQRAIDDALRQVASARRVFARRHDPSTVLSSIKVPALAVYFGKDDIVPQDVNEPPLRAAIAHGGNSQFSVTVFPEYGHNMCSVEPERIMPALPRVPAQDVLAVVGEWLVDNAKR